MTLPKSASFSCGRWRYTCKVKVVSHFDLQKLAGVLPGDDQASACWRSDHKTIYIAAGLSDRDTWHGLFHEMDHAWVDARYDFEVMAGYSK